MGSKRIHLAQRRKAVGYSQDKLAEQLGVERSTVVRWEASESDPQPWVRQKLAETLQVSLSELDTLLHTAAAPETRNEGVRFALDNPSSADLTVVSNLRERIRQLDDSYSESPSTTLLGPTGQIHGQVSYVRQHASDARVRRALFEVEAESATLMGQLVWDLSQRHDHAGTVAYLDQALDASRQARDQHAESYAMLRKSFVSLYGERDPRTGRARAHQAADIARRCSRALEGLALLHVAESHAMTSETTLCHQALARAADQLERVDGDDVAACYYTPMEFDRLAGSCYLFLGRPAQAEPYLERTTSGPTVKQKSHAIALSNLTLALIRQRKTDEAVSTIHQAIDAVEQTRGGGGLNLVFAAGRELRVCRAERAAAEVADRLFALMTTR